MATSLDYATDRIVSFITSWGELAPDVEFAGMTLAEFEAATAPPKAKRKEIGELLALLAAKRQERDLADEEALKLVNMVLNSIKADLRFGDNSGLYRSLGYVTKSDRKTGLVRKKRKPAAE